jgi:phage-related protein
MSYPLATIFLAKVNDFINSLSEENQKKFALAITSLSEGDFQAVYIKQIKGEIKELRIKEYRLMFFIHKNTIYFVNVFLKKSNKTPTKEIEFTEKYYKLITNN